jgi:hypothetical protein
LSQKGETMRPIICISAFLGIGFSHIDSDRLEQIRLSMESYLSRIDSIEITYNQTWKASDEGKKAIAASQMKEQERVKVGSAEERQVLEKILRRVEADRVTTYTLLDAFPSFRLDINVQRRLPDGSSEHSHVRKIVHDGQYTEIDPGRKTVNTTRSVNMRLLPRSPINALGRRVDWGLGQPLTQLLKHPDITTLIGQEKLHGIDTVIVKVGPGLPGDCLPENVGERTYYKFWLAPSYYHLPIKSEFNFEIVNASRPEPHFAVHSTELSDFQPARDNARKQDIPFPRVLTFTDKLGTTHWDVERVAINVPATAQAFRPVIPDGFLISRDGSVPTVTLSGGPEAKGRAVKATIQQAAKELSQAPLPASRRRSTIQLRTVVPLVFLVVIVLLILIRTRRR